MTTIDKVGTEFLVNTQTAIGQRLPAITTLANGGFVVAWNDDSGTLGDSNSLSIKAQLFDATGNKVGTEFLVNTQTANAQLSPKVTALSNGGFVVTWYDASGTLGDSSGYSIKAQVFDAIGNKVGTEFLVNTQTANDQLSPNVTALSTGGFVVTWQDQSGTLGDSSGSSIKAQVFNATGAKLGSEFLVNTQTAGDEYSPTVAGLSGGGFVVAWNDDRGDSSFNSIKAQIFDVTGNKVGTESVVNTQTANLQYSPSVTALSTGGFVVTWQDQSGTLGDSSGYSIKAQLFDATGNKVGTEFLVNTQTANDQLSPNVTALSTGGFVITWYDGSGTLGDSSGKSIKAQVFDATGNKVGTEFLVNTQTGNDQMFPAVTDISTGGFVVAWEDHSGTLGDSSGSSIKAQIFTLNASSDQTYSLSPNPASINENTGTFTFTINRTNVSQAADVYISTVQDQGFSNPSNKYYDGLVSQTLHFNANQSSAIVSLTIHDLGLTSGSETFRLIAQQSPGDSNLNNYLATDTFTIVNNDAPSYWISPSHLTVNESGGGTITFTVTRSSTTQAETDYVSTVQNWQGSGVFNTNPQTGATNYFYNGIDSQPLLHFNAGDKTASVTVTINDAGLTSGCETFGFIVQQTPTSSTVASASFTIINDDTGSPPAPPPPATPLPWQEFAYAADAVYPNHPSLNFPQMSSPPHSLLLLGQPVTDTFDLSGFHAEAFQDDSGNIIIAYEGTRTDFDLYSAGSLLADGGILQGHFDPAGGSTSPSARAAKALRDTLRYAENFATVIHNAFPANKIYVTGHSLGGAEGEYVAKNLNFISGGATFGAPGLPGYFNSIDSDQTTFINYVDYGDPIGNYASDTNSALHYASLTGDHFGAVKLIGDKDDASDLQGLSSADLNIDVSKLTALLAIGHHFRPWYWDDLFNANQHPDARFDVSALSDVISKIAQVAQLPDVGVMLIGAAGAELLSAGLGNNFFWATAAPQ